MEKLQDGEKEKRERDGGIPWLVFIIAIIPNSDCFLLICNEQNKHLEL